MADEPHFRGYRPHTSQRREGQNVPLGEGDLGGDGDLGSVAGDGDLASKATSAAINLDALVQEGLLENGASQYGQGRTRTEGHRLRQFSNEA